MLAREARVSRASEAGQRVADSRLGLAAILACCIGVPLLSAWATGAIRIPHNDDWAYLRILFTLADTGALQLVGWNEAMLVGHLAWAVPVAEIFGASIAPLVVINALISATGLVLTYVLARRFLYVVYSLWVAFMVGIFPGFAALVTTFMTEPAAYAGQVGCLVLGVRALDREGHSRLGALIGSLVVGVYAFSVREFAIAAPIAVVVALFVAEKNERRTSKLSVTALAALVAACLGLYLWRHTFPDDSSHFFRIDLGGDLVVHVTQSYFTLSLALLPALLWVKANGRLHPMTVFVAAVPLPLAGLAVMDSAGDPTCCLGGSGSVFVGNLLTERGVLGNQVVAGIRPTLFPAPIWWALSAAAVVAGCLLAGRMHRAFVAARGEHRHHDLSVVMLAVFGALTGAALIFRAALGGPLFDRYLTPLVLVGAILVMRGRTEREATRGRLAPVVLALLGLLSVILVTSGHNFDAARWRAAEIGVASGVPPRDVDGGFEWVGFHNRGVADRNSARRPDDLGPGYMDLFATAGNCAIVMSSPSTTTSLQTIDRVGYRTLLGLNEETMWLYRVPEACDDKVAP